MRCLQLGCLRDLHLRLAGLVQPAQRPARPQQSEPAALRAGPRPCLQAGRQEAVSQVASAPEERGLTGVLQPAQASPHDDQRDLRGAVAEVESDPLDLSLDSQHLALQLAAVCQPLFRALSQQRFSLHAQQILALVFEVFEEVRADPVHPGQLRPAALGQLLRSQLLQRSQPSAHLHGQRLARLLRPLLELSDGLLQHQRIRIYWLPRRG